MDNHPVIRVMATCHPGFERQAKGTTATPAAPETDHEAHPSLAVILACQRRDIRGRRLPEAITLPSMSAGMLQGAFEVGGWPTDRAIGALAGFVVFWLPGKAFRRWRKVEGLGQGDEQLLAAAGRRIAFGPWPALASWLLWLWQLGQ